MNNLAIALSVAGFIWILEQFLPMTKLDKTKYWYLRALVFNGMQFVIAISGTYLWDIWFAKVQLFSYSHLSLFSQVLIGYITITFVYYWWHRFRHSVPILWRFLHQFHHSPARIEVITSFYKSPVEILVNGLLTSAILYIFLGLSVNAVGLCVLVTGLMEFIYHMNLKTPWLMGFLFQRPEMHHIHHQRGLHYYNFSDLPIWDMLFGTYKNPRVIDNQTGFPDNNELKIKSLLSGKKLKA